MTLAILLLIVAGTAVLSTLISVASPRIPAASKVGIVIFQSFAIVVTVLAAVQLM